MQISDDWFTAPSGRDIVTEYKLRQMGLSNYVSTYQHDFSTASKGFRGRRSLSASNLNAATGAVAAPMMYGNRPTTRGGNREIRGGVTIDGREVPAGARVSYGASNVNNVYRPAAQPSMSSRMYGGGGGAHGRAMAFGGGSTKPPMVDNYLDSHGLNSGLGNAGASKFPSVVESRPIQAARMANYTRFSPADWSSSNMSHYNSADNARNNSERIRNEAMRLMRDREDKTILTQRDADRRIGERLHDVTFWRSELQSELERNMNETHHLMETRKNLERALNETEGPMRITSENIYNREGRKGIDLVNDNPENNLMREVDTIKGCQDKMRKTLEQVNHQLGVNRNSRHQLERDLANKDQAISIDHHCHQLQNSSRAINVHGGIEKMDPNVSIPDTWAENSTHNVTDSQGARSSSQRLRADVDNLVTTCANDMWSAWSNSNTALQQRVTETTDAHNKLQSHLAKTQQEIYDQEKHISGLQKAVRDKEAPLKVSQTRLEARTHRPDVELCRDPVYHRLVEEVGQITESVDLLHRKLGEAESAHQDLLVNKGRLEHDLKVKSNSLFIDREKCLSARKSFPVVSLATKL